MTEAQVLALITSVITTNGNNEITGAALQAVLEAVLTQPNDKVGELEDLNTTDKTNIVAAINEVLQGTGYDFSVSTGTDNPNLSPPSNETLGNWYIQNNSVIYQYNGSAWIALKAVKKDSFTYTSPNNTFTLSETPKEILDVQVGHGCNYDSYLTIANDIEATIDNSIIFGGEKIKIIYTY